MATRDPAHEILPAFRRALLALAGLALAVTGCMADPMPTPGRPDRLKILISSTTSSRNGGPVDLVGVIGITSAAPGAGQVLLRQVLSGTVTIAQAAEDGTFAAVLSGAAGDRITVTFREMPDGPESEPVDLDIATFESGRAPETPNTAIDAAGGGDEDAPSLRSSGPSASPPDGRGRVTVTGEHLTPGQVVAIGNVRTGEVTEVTVGADGTFSTAVAAAAGDTLVVIVRDPASGSTSGMASISIGSP